jgi:hypothetical protein
MFRNNRTFDNPRRVIDGAIILIGALLALAIGMANGPKVHAADYDYIGVFGAFSASQPSADPKVFAGARLVDILERTPDGGYVAWLNPETGATYQVHVLTTVTSGVGSCRTFTVRRTAAASVRESHRTACREAKGVWEISTYPGADGIGRDAINKQ